MKAFNGNVLFLDRNDINTDEIIPAKYLTESTKDALKPYLLEDIKLDGFNVKTDIKDRSIIVTRENFGCGSSREHAPWALEVNGINTVLAESFARIFRQNMFNCGMMAIELPKETLNEIFRKYKNKEIQMEIDVESEIIKINSQNEKETVKFSIGDFEKALVKAGGWVDYADAHY